MSEFRMPSLGADMVKGTLVEWRVAAGDHVTRGDVICEVETDKGVIEVEVWESGVVRDLLVTPGTVVPVGGVLAVIDVPGVEVPAADAPVAEASAAGAPVTDAPAFEAPAAEAPATEAPVAEAPATEASAADVAARPPSPPASPPRPPVSPGQRITPAARVRAAALGIDLATVDGSGPGGAVTSEDVERAAHRMSPSPAPATGFPHEHVTPLARRIADAHGLAVDAIAGSGVHGSVTRADLEPLLAHPAEQSPTATPAAGTEPGPTSRTDGLRAAIAAAMARSKREIPHYYLQETVDVTATVAWLERYNRDRPPAERVLFTAVLMHAVAHATAQVEGMNGTYIEGRYEPSEAVHLGVAIAMRDGGVIAPALRDAHARDLSQTMDGLRDLVARTRRGKLRASEMMDGTLTLTALGELGAESVFGVIYPPQVALVGCGRIQERAWAHDGLLGVRSVVRLTLAADHRVSDGIAGSRFLLAIRERLEQPEDA